MTQLVQGSVRAAATRPAEELSLSDISRLLPFLLRPENVVHYDDGIVRIADRRVYPFEHDVVLCHTTEDVAVAIEKMVTQGSGPRLAAMYGLVLEARHTRTTDPQGIEVALEAARDRLIATRPTNTSVPRGLKAQLDACLPLIRDGGNAERILLDYVRAFLDTYYRRCVILAGLTAEQIRDGAGILSVCFAETAFVLGIALAREQGKEVSAYVTETRPYLQGSRLTAPALHEMGIPVRLITDNMGAHVMAEGKIDVYFSATDVVTMDGHVVNKIGTFQLALAADYHGIPYFAITHGPDPRKATAADCVIEVRSADEVRSVRGVEITPPDIDAYYPAFDVTPPHLIAGIITEKGTLSPYMIRSHFGA